MAYTLCIYILLEEGQREKKREKKEGDEVK
jgi:hypothetical protein